MITIQDIINKYANIDLYSGILEIEDIPNIDLYMDQLTTFIEQSLQSYKRNEEDKILTKTMINNYTKAKIFPPPIKKKYTKIHIMLLVIIYHLKSILSITDIGKLLEPILPASVLDEDAKKIEEVYSYVIEFQKQTYLNIKSSAQGNRESILKEMEIIKNIEDETIKKIVLVLVLSGRAYAEKRLAETILDNDFDDDDKKILPKNTK